MVWQKPQMFPPKSPHTRQENRIGIWTWTFGFLEVLNYKHPSLSFLLFKTQMKQHTRFFNEERLSVYINLDYLS